MIRYPNLGLVLDLTEDPGERDLPWKEFQLTKAFIGDMINLSQYSGEFFILPALKMLRRRWKKHGILSAVQSVAIENDFISREMGALLAEERKYIVNISDNFYKTT